ncbi:MAG: polyketide synthase, partial [Deltaproteobacteria bacterium]|nr:polyketide synthase [Deltaproteobacteria bacterium]
MACWFPGAENVVQLWENVVAGRQQFRQMPNERMPLAHYHSPDPKTPDMTYGRKAAVIDGFVFDWRGAKIPRPTFETTDVSHWLALEVAGRALRSAGYPSQPSSKDRFGVIVGNTLTGEQSRANAMRLRWPYVRSAFLAALGEEELASSEMLSRFERQYKASLPPVSEDSLAGALSNTIAGRICGRHDLGGGGYTVDAACASSLLAVTTAAERLVAGDLDVALAGGVDVSLDPFELVGFSKAGALAREAMRVYDQRAAGFIPGEGCGFVVLKRLRDAVAAGDRVFAVMRGWGVSSDGSHPIMAPRLDGQIRALRRAYDKAELDPGVIDFVEGHGTGTVVGDRTEITALGAVIGRRAQNSVGLTSLKAVVGHCKAAAGIGAFIKAVVGVNRRCVPPIPGCERPSEVFEQASGRLFPVRSGVMMADAHKPRAGVSAMGFGGINVHAIVEAAGPPASELAPALPERQLLASRQDSELLVVDASSEEEMRQRVDELRKLARGMSVGEMPDLAAACAKREGGRGIRAAIVTGNDESLLEQRLDELHRLASDGIGREPGRRPGIWLGSTDPGCSPRVGMLFPGQGSQLVGAARFLVDRFEWAEAMTSLASTVAAEFRTSDLRDVLYPSEVEGMDEARLAATHRAQPGICLVSLLWLRFLRELGI